MAMRSDVEASRSRPPVLKRAVAGVVLVAVAALAVLLVVHIVVAIFWVVVVVVAIAAVLWALNTVL